MPLLVSSSFFVPTMPPFLLSFWPTVLLSAQVLPTAVIRACRTANEKQGLGFDYHVTCFSSHCFLGEVPVVTCLVDGRQVKSKAWK